MTYRESSSVVSVVVRQTNGNWKRNGTLVRKENENTKLCRYRYRFSRGALLVVVVTIVLVVVL
jgi:hypothetical protein